MDCPLATILAYISSHNLSYLLYKIDIKNYNRLAILTLSKTMPLYLFSLASSPSELIFCNIFFTLMEFSFPKENPLLALLAINYFVK